jgi:hypothetical protein
MGAAIAGVLLVGVLGVGTLGLVRWNAAGEVHPIDPPGGAIAWAPGGGAWERTVADRAAIIARGLRSERGPARVRSYVLPAGSPWLQSRKIVATQLDHWEQRGDCADRPEARIVECVWREPTRWWPREVRLTMLRPPPPEANRDGWPDRTFVIIGSGRSD